ncbi:hypothetical protein SEA_ZOOMAN_287 [Microbacterium phage Zooman]|nr:hypothetical protein SEA_ZOOMAN_287 [Microbacterium phage Zooman]
MSNAKNRALPPRPEPEVIYRSDQPPSGEYFLYVEVDDGKGGWERITYGDFRIARGSDRAPMSSDTWWVRQPDDNEESRHRAKRQALNYANLTHLLTRVVREQALI